MAEVGGVVSGGKEAAVFYAVGGASATMSVPSEAAIKVFKKHSPFKTKSVGWWLWLGGCGWVAVVGWLEGGVVVGWLKGWLGGCGWVTGRGGCGWVVEGVVVVWWLEVCIEWGRVS